MPHASDERAVADVMGSMLLVALTVSMVAGLGALIFGAVPGPTPPVDIALEIVLEPHCPWGGGDEQVHIRHLGGEALASPAVSVVIGGNGAATWWDHASRNESGDGDGLLEIGEGWIHDGVQAEAGDLLTITVVRGSDPPLVLQSTDLRASEAACGVAP